MTVNSTPGRDEQTLWIATDRTVYRGQLEPIFMMANATDADELTAYLNALESRALAAEAALAGYKYGVAYIDRACGVTFIVPQGEEPPEFCLGCTEHYKAEKLHEVAGAAEAALRDTEEARAFVEWVRDEFNHKALGPDWRDLIDHLPARAALNRPTAKVELDPPPRYDAEYYKFMDSVDRPTAAREEEE
jgi:hypothetical protein